MPKLGKAYLAYYQDNATEEDIRSWCLHCGLPVGQQHKVFMSVHSHKSLPILTCPYMLPGCKLPQPTYIVMQHYKVTMSVSFRKSVSILILPYMLHGHKTPTTNPSPILRLDCICITDFMLPDGVAEWVERLAPMLEDQGIRRSQVRVRFLVESNQWL